MFSLEPDLETGNMVLSQISMSARALLPAKFCPPRMNLKETYSREFSIAQQLSDLWNRLEKRLKINSETPDYITL